MAYPIQHNNSTRTVSLWAQEFLPKRMQSPQDICALVLRLVSD